MLLRSSWVGVRVGVMVRVLVMVMVWGRVNLNIRQDGPSSGVKLNLR